MTNNDVRDEYTKSLIERKKLHLVLDLDHTLLHAIKTQDLTFNDQQYLKTPHGQNLLKQGKLRIWPAKENNLLRKKDEEWMIKLRPNVQTFLKEANKLFDLTIFTLGSRTYTRMMLDILDPEGLYFPQSRVITREDCTTTSKKGFYLVLSDERVTLVVDDRKELWEDNAKNLIQIVPYKFFDDVSSEKRPWSRDWTDESEKYGELARVLIHLKNIHNEFYDIEERQNCNSRDVKDVIDELKRRFSLLGTKKGRHLISQGVKEALDEVRTIMKLQGY